MYKRYLIIYTFHFFVLMVQQSVLINYKEVRAVLAVFQQFGPWSRKVLQVEHLPPFELRELFNIYTYLTYFL